MPASPSPSPSFPSPAQRRASHRGLGGWHGRSSGARRRRSRPSAPATRRVALRLWVLR